MNKKPRQCPGCSTRCGPYTKYCCKKVNVGLNHNASNPVCNIEEIFPDREKSRGDHEKLDINKSTKTTITIQEPPEIETEIKAVVNKPRKMSEWFKELPGGYAKLAINNIRGKDDVVDNLEIALINIAPRTKTKEGVNFWRTVYEYSMGDIETLPSL